MWSLNNFELIFLLIIFIISIWIHEYAHAITSSKFSDPSPKINGNLSLNPLKHISIIWLIPVIFINFWRWKAANINHFYYKNTVVNYIIVSFAGIIANIILAIIWVLVLILYWKYWIWLEHPSIINITNDVFLSLLTIFIYTNIIIATINLLPIPPLDWFRIVKFFYPQISKYFEKYWHYLAILFFLIIIYPTSWNTIKEMILSIWDFIYWILFLIISNMIY